MVKKNSTLLTLKNGAHIMKINIKDNHFIDNFCGLSTIQEIQKKEHEKFNDKLIMLEKIEIKNIKCDKHFTYYIPNCDTLTNISIITQKNVKLINILLVGVFYNEHNEKILNFKKNIVNKTNVYKITNFDNIVHYNNMSYHDNFIKFTFDSETIFTLNYDRGFGQSKIRVSIANVAKTEESYIDISKLNFKTNENE